MLHAYRDDERRRITVTASGTVTFVDLVTFVERQLAGEHGGGVGVAWTARLRKPITDET